MSLGSSKLIKQAIKNQKEEANASKETSAPIELIGTTKKTLGRFYRWLRHKNHTRKMRIKSIAIFRSKPVALQSPFGSTETFNSSNNLSSVTSEKSLVNSESHKLTKIIFSQPFQIFIGIVVVLPLVFILLNLYQADKYISSYSITFERSNFANVSSPASGLVINEDPNSYKFGQDQNFDGYSVPEILSSPINLTWYPSQFPLGKDITLSMKFVDEGDWDVSLVCPNCSQSGKNNWKPIYRGKLNSYSFVNQFEGSYLYSAKPNQYQSASNIKDWLTENKIGLANSFEIYDNAINLNEISNSNVGFVEGKGTVIPYTLRGPHQFYLYLKDKLNLSVIKKDLNYAKGTDNVTVSLSDLQGNTLLESTIPDDNVRNDDPNQPVEINLDNLPYEGTYLLSFDGNSDWTLNNLSVNTNKIVFNGANLILDPGSLYTKVNIESSLRAFVWQDTALQTLEIKGDTATNNYNLNAGNLGFNKYIDLKPGEYTISFNGTQVLDDYYFAINKDTYYDPFLIELNTPANSDPDFIISDVPKADDGVVTTTFTKEDYLKLDNLKQIRFTLRNTNLDSRYNKDQIQLSSGYVPLGTFQQMKIWGLQNAKINLSGNSLSDIIANSFPDNSKIYVSTPYQLSQNDYINNTEPSGFVPTDSPTNNINLSLRGSHVFYLYAKDKVIANITKEDLNWYEGADNVDVIVSDFDNNQICKYQIADDGNTTTDKATNNVSLNFSCLVPKEGIYQLSLQEHVEANQQPKSDYLITNISINTNKFVAKGKVLNTQPITLYTNNQSNWQFAVYYWIDGMDQTIKVTDSKSKSKDVVLTADDININKTEVLSKGSWTIFSPKGNVSVSGSNYAFKPDNWFDTYKVILTTTDSNVDYKIINYPYLTPSYIISAGLSIN